ncbi:MAG: pyruvate dehydrogenase (acetyl-transferring), homodimeric type [Acidobacteriota bacterium]|nr:MAG: pyruvate dehydrogenase (acetyl-transferring), homodimeric type [Acidobacteriota bacterium]
MADPAGSIVKKVSAELDSVEKKEWLDSLDYVFEEGGPEKVINLLRELELYATRKGVDLPFTANTPYINTIPVAEQVPYPGNREIERRIKSLVRWNAMAMVVRANREEDGIGGHISTFASAATLYEVGFNHFFRGAEHDCGGDLVYFQGHGSPGVYSRAYLEGRLTASHLRNFRRELAPGGGLSSYPHPWLMPDFWQFPTVSMGLGPLMSIYQARFTRYLEGRGLKQPTDAKVVAFLGDGETDEPETLGSISLASREGLDNLIWIVNCNLQRLDGPVRGNGKIIQELEAVFRGAGWNVIKVIWGSEWDHLLEDDEEGLLVNRMEETVDGEYQKFSVETGSFIREEFFGKTAELKAMVDHLSDEELRRLKRGGHDPVKLYSAFKTAYEHKGSPTVILAKTIKGYGLGEAGEGKNITHSQKKLNEAELRYFRDRFGVPISDEDVAQAPFYKPPETSAEIQYLQERRQKLGGYLPSRRVTAEPLKTPAEEFFSEFFTGTAGREVSTTMVVVRLLAKLLRDKSIGKLIVPIVPDEARTFGLEALFSQVGIYSSKGQLYEPVDAGGLMYYKEATNGQILEEGITEAGSMSSFIAAGTAYANHGINTIPFFLYYSMFGFQRIGDLIWAAGDLMCKGFLIGATSGRTTLNGEGLQHEDGHSHLLAYPVPNVMAYDPSFAYEIAVIVREGIRRMYENQEDLFYYLTVGNENYEQPSMPEKDRERVIDGIVNGIYKLKATKKRRPKLRVDLLGSGAIMNCVLRAQRVLEEDFGVAADVWSVTSYKELHRSGLEVDRWNRFHPGEKPRVPYLTEKLTGSSGVYVAASDYVKALPESVSRWIPGRLVSLGTDGYGRSETREALRDFFEVDHRHVTVAALYGLMLEGKVEASVVEKAIKKLGIDPGKVYPVFA